MYSHFTEDKSQISKPTALIAQCSLLDHQHEKPDIVCESVPVLAASAALLAEGHSSGRKPFESLPECADYLFSITLHLLAHSSKNTIGTLHPPIFNTFSDILSCILLGACFQALTSEKTTFIIKTLLPFR